MLKQKTSKWSKAVAEVGWERLWLLQDGGKIFGDITLTQQHQIKTSLHRATLMMGLQSDYRGKGWGSRMLNHAHSWAREQKSLDWIDLGVFGQNTVAFKLYTKAGFKEVGRVPDLFRVNGQKIEDIQMALNLRG
jgi:ribosomal protein S18 acetylase RimI-like enzyme